MSIEKKELYGFKFWYKDLPNSPTQYVSVVAHTVKEAIGYLRAKTWVCDAYDKGLDTFYYEAQFHDYHKAGDIYFDHVRL